MDGFDFFRDAFNKFAAQVDGQDVALRLVRSVGAGGKAFADKGLEEFSRDYVRDMVDSAYSLLTSQDLAEGISASVRSFDEEKLQGLLDGVVAKLQEDETAGQLAKQVKDLLTKLDNDQIEGAFDQLIPEDRLQEKMIFMALFMQARPILDEMRFMDENELKEKIKELSRSIPTDFISAQVGALTRQVTPESISQQAHAVVGQLPSGATIADIVQGLGKSASKAFDKVSKAKTLVDAANALEFFGTDAASVISGKIADDQASKAKFNKKGGGGFDF